MNQRYCTWYVTLIAAYYLIVCTANTVYSIATCFDAGSIHSLRELFMLCGAAFAWLYFIKPLWGHRGLIVLTVVTILAIGETNPSATMFHFAMLALLVLPLCTRRAKLIQKPSITAKFM